MPPWESLFGTVLYGKSALRYLGNLESQKARIPDYWPTCAVCKKPVDLMTQANLPGDRSMRFTALCHGETEETVISLHDVAEMQSLGALKGGMAFNRRRITDEQHPEIPVQD